MDLLSRKLSQGSMQEEEVEASSINEDAGIWYSDNDIVEELLGTPRFKEIEC